MVLRVHVGCALDHRGRTAGLCDSLGFSRQPQELHFLVGQPHQGGKGALRAERSGYRAEGLHQNGVEPEPPATRLENKLYPWVYFAILPLFALTNADVSFVDGSLGNIFADPALYGVFFGLLLGKPIGIMLFSFIIVKTKLASLPEHANWGHMFGAGILGGVGFTMAIFVANLAFDDPAIVTTAKLAILSASLIAGVVGFLVLFVQANAARKKGVAYIATASDDAGHPASDKEYVEAGKRMLEEIESPLLKEEIEAAQREGDGYAEIVVELGSDDRRSDRAADEGSADPDRIDDAGASGSGKTK